MSYSWSRRQIVSIAVLGLLEVTTSGCGTVMHPERRGQAAGPLDWGIVALDAVGLLFFFIPGVIAFAVDFNNGTIYLPNDGRAGQMQNASQSQPQQLIPVATSQPQPTPQMIENAIARETGHQVRLLPGSFRTKVLQRLDQFWSTRADFETA